MIGRRNGKRKDDFENLYSLNLSLSTMTIRFQNETLFIGKNNSIM